MSDRVAILPSACAATTPATRHGIPWRLVYNEEFQTRLEALRRERFLKSGKGREFLNKQLRTGTQERVD